jgi:hypothetical protein
MKPLIYIASPYTQGDVALNTRFQMRVFDELMTEGVVIPFAPLVGSHFQHLAFPRQYSDWVNYDLDLIRRGIFDACIRLNVTDERMPGYSQEASNGADGEVSEFIRQRKIVFFDKVSMNAWATNEWGKQQPGGTNASM